MTNIRTHTVLFSNKVLRSIEDLLGAEKSETFQNSRKVSSSIEEKKKKLTQAGLFQSKIPDRSSAYGGITYGVKRAEISNSHGAKKGEIGSSQRGISRPNIKSAANGAKGWNSSSESESERTESFRLLTFLF